MHFIKNKFICFILIILILTFFIKPCFASDTSYVWSEISSPTIETAASLSQDKRKLFKSYLW